MGDRLLVGRAAQRALARLAPPLDREVVEPGLGKMMGDRLGFVVSLDERLRRAPVERLAAALQEAVVRRSPESAQTRNGRSPRDALDEEKVRVQEAAQSDLERAFIEFLVADFARTGMATVDEGRVRSDVAQNYIGKAPTQHRPRSARLRAPIPSGRGARRAIAPKSAGSPSRPLVRRVREAGASPPPRTTARRPRAR